MSRTIYTIGHSTHPIEEFLAMLEAFEIQTLVDVRTIPKSRHNPQFNEDVLAKTLEDQGIGYVHLDALGGLRKTSPDSVNQAWRNDSFRGYADYMQTSEFSAGIEQLLEIAAKARVAIMCAEAVPWRCHRSLIGDALLVRGVQVVDIMSQTSSNHHKMTGFARVDGLKITYPKESAQS